MKESRDFQVRVIRPDDAYLQSPQALQHLGQRIQSLMSDGERVVVVHGGNMEVFERYKQIYARGSGDSSFSMISEGNMPMMVMVLGGEINKRVVTHLNQEGLKALGVSGADAGLMVSTFLNYQHLGRVGGPPRVDGEAFEYMLTHYSPLVVSPLCSGPDGGLLVLDPDTTAQSIAGAMQSDILEFVLQEPHLQTADGQPLLQLTETDVSVIMEYYVGTKLVPKLQAALSALSSGVTKVIFGNFESLSQGQGTVISRA